MKVCIAQTKPIRGDIDSNIEAHKRLIDLAVSNHADAIIFPELSLTGYEPTLAQALAISPDDNRLDVFQTISDAHKITIGLGVPTKTHSGICISMIIFQPHQERRVYSKKYLHPDEEDFFIHGENFAVLKVGAINIALAICYEISVPQHEEDAFNSGAAVYIASVAKFERGIDAATKRLSDIAKKHSTIVLMANCIGQSDGDICAGKSSVWSKEGKLIAQLNGQQEGIIIVDTDSQVVLERTI
jgi:predicted amidohydrolase